MKAMQDREYFKKKQSQNPTTKMTWNLNFWPCHLEVHQKWSSKWYNTLGSSYKTGLKLLKWQLFRCVSISWTRCVNDRSLLKKYCNMSKHTHVSEILWKILHWRIYVQLLDLFWVAVLYLILLNAFIHKFFIIRDSRGIEKIDYFDLGHFI